MVAADEQACELSRLKQELELLRKETELARRRVVVRRLLSEFDLPDPEAADPVARIICSERFLETLFAAPHEQTMRDLVADRARLVRMLSGELGRTRARDQHLTLLPQDTESFIEAIT